VASTEYLEVKKHTKVRTAMNVVDLVNKIKREKRKEKKHTIILAAAAVSALVISGFVISL
tara:strand:- start:53 stop:232 length:180 start_codon:yes stop_codon:yes gene_type:complete